MFHALRDSLLCGLAILLVGPTVSAAPPTDQQLIATLTGLKKQLTEVPREVDARSIADAEVCAKAIEWALRYNEFPKPRYRDWAGMVGEVGKERLNALANGKTSDWKQPGKTVVLGYRSLVDESFQPYAVALPKGFDPKADRKWPLYVRLHGRTRDLTEVSFFGKHHGKETPADQEWIELHVFGRTNNAYRFSGETDVFEAIGDLRSRLPIDDQRIVLWGFSMGGAGAWHLGLHHPSKWVSAGAGAGFVDFYRYQNVKEKLPEYQHRTLGIYDAEQYAMNAASVPFITYGGELDKQILASETMVAAAKEHGVEINFLIGPKMGHKFDPESLKTFMAFHAGNVKRGRPKYLTSVKNFRFETRTLKYNTCEWITIEEMFKQYAPTRVECHYDENGAVHRLTTQNVAVLRIDRNVNDRIIIDGDLLALSEAADGLLPDVYYQKGPRGWIVLDYETSKAFSSNPLGMKRHDLQGPIDDAFMQPFLCVRGSGQPWSSDQQTWADFNYTRFADEFARFLRGDVPTIDAEYLTEAQIASKNLVLFGDPGSNPVLKKILPDLPITWTKDEITFNGTSYPTKTHGLCMIFPNPLNPRRYVVINSGHTFHEREFKASNAQLIPRLGDAAIVKFTPDRKRGLKEETVEAVIFNGGWRFPPKAD